jgi:hypothetical protein
LHNTTLTLLVKLYLNPLLFYENITLKVVVAFISIMIKRITIELVGNVQDDNYRSNCKSIADNLGITGYIKNSSLKGAETVAEGDRKK